MPKTYTVGAGDYAGKIAKQQGISLDDLIKWNNLTPPDYVVGKGAKLIISDPDVIDEANKELEYDICEIEHLAENEMNALSLNGSDESCNSSAQCCAQEEAQQPVNKDCTFETFKLSSSRGDTTREYIHPNNTNQSTQHYFEIVAGYGTSPAEVKLSVQGLKIVNCNLQHKGNVIYAEVEEKHKPTSDTAYTYPVTHSYFIQQLSLPSLPFSSIINHNWHISTCAKEEALKIKAYPDDKLTISASVTPFKKDWSRNYQQTMLPKKYTYIDPAMGSNEELEGHILEFNGNPEYIYKSTTNNPVLFYAKLEFDGGSESIEAQYQYSKTKGIETVKNPIPDDFGKWKSYEQKIEEIKETTKKYLEIKKKISKLLDEGFCGKGKTTKIDWGIYCTIGFKGIFNFKELENSNYCGFSYQLGFFLSAGASATIDFANKLLVAVPVIGPGLLALNVGLSELDMGGLYLRLIFSSSIDVDLNVKFYKSFETNKFVLKEAGGKFESHFVKIRLEIGLSLELKKEVDLLFVKAEFVASLKGEIWGQTGLYAKGDAYYSGATDPNIDLGYLSAEVKALYAVKVGADFSSKTINNKDIASEIGSKTIDEEEKKGGIGFDHKGETDEWKIWDEGSFFSTPPKKIKDIF